MSKEVETKITSGVHQEGGSAVFGKEDSGSLEKIDNNWRLKYNEENKAGDVEAKLLVKPNELVV